MKTSLVTISFNQRQFLLRALDSVKMQDLPALEYIVVDPGSDDGSRELISGYGPPISQVVLEPDRGPADGLNKGFRLATGEIYGFLNADDYLLPGALRAVQAYFVSHPDCDILMGDGIIVDADERALRQVHARSFTATRFIYGGSTWLQQATFFRAEAFWKIGAFNENNRTCWDGELFLKMAHAGASIHYLAQDLACFRLHSASITGKSIATRTKQSPYVADQRRLFEEIRGRKWDVRDDLARFAIQIHRKLQQPQEVVESLRFRLRTRQCHKSS